MDLCVCVCMGSLSYRDLEERRIYVHVFKHLRRQQAKLDRDPSKPASAGDA